MNLNPGVGLEYHMDDYYFAGGFFETVLINSALIGVLVMNAQLVLIGLAWASWVESLLVMTVDSHHV